MNQGQSTTKSKKELHKKIDGFFLQLPDVNEPITKKAN